MFEPFIAGEWEIEDVGYTTEANDRKSEELRLYRNIFFSEPYKKTVFIFRVAINLKLPYYGALKTEKADCCNVVKPLLRAN